MNSSQAAVAAGFMGANYALVLFISVALLVLLVVARWKLFTKAGEAGWKSIIPIYSDYTQWKIGWKKKGLFWVSLLLTFAGYFLGYATGAFAGRGAGSIAMTGNSTIFGWAGLILILATIIISLIASYKLMASFGHGIGWFILYLFFPGIMLLVLGFGSSRYLGPQD